MNINSGMIVCRSSKNNREGGPGSAMRYLYSICPAFVRHARNDFDHIVVWMIEKRKSSPLLLQSAHSFQIKRVKALGIVRWKMIILIARLQTHTPTLTDSDDDDATGLTPALIILLLGESETDFRHGLIEGWRLLVVDGDGLFSGGQGGDGESAVIVVVAMMLEGKQRLLLLLLLTDSAAMDATVEEEE